MAHPRKPPYKRKNLADISHTNRVIANFVPNFVAMAVGVHNVITQFKFSDDRFRGFGLAEGQSLPFPIDFEGRPYNTHTIV